MKYHENLKKEQIGRLQRVELRDVWSHEAHDFTRWLEQNIDVLNEAIGFTLSIVERETAAGDFRVDLVGRGMNRDNLSLLKTNWSAVTMTISASY